MLLTVDTSWNILTEKTKDVSWNIFILTTENTIWNICKRMTRVLSWHIINPIAYAQANLEQTVKDITDPKFAAVEDEIHQH